MSTVSTSFTSATVGASLLVKSGDKLTYTVSGTFVGTWVVESTENAGISYDVVATGTGSASAVSVLCESSGGQHKAYRFRCSAYTSGTMVTSLADASSDVKISQEVKDINGMSVLQVVDGGIVLPGTLSVSGAIASPSMTSPAMAVSSGQRTRYCNFFPGTLTAGTSTTPSATVVYLSQIYINANCTLTGVAVNNGATVGTDKYIVALFSSAGAALANSALAGTTTAGADAWQSVAFTATYAASGPAVYWIALYVNGTTDRFRSIPALGAYAGLAGSVSGQSFGTVAALTLPTTFTADLGPVAFVY